MSERAIGHTRNVPVSAKHDMPVLLGEGNLVTGRVRVLNDVAVLILRKTGSGVDTSRRLSGRRHLVTDADVSQLAEVGRTGRLQRIPRQKRVGPHVVAGLIRSRVRHEVGMDEREVVAAGGKTTGVLVDQIGELNRVETGVGRLGRVVRPLATTAARVPSQKRNVLGGPSEHNDSVRKTNIEGGTSRDILERSVLSALDLVNKHITRGVTHLDTLIVVNDGVVSLSLRVTQSRLLVLGTEDVHIRAGSRTTGTWAIGAAGGGGTRVDDNKLLPLADHIVDVDLVERKSGNRKCDTTVLAEEERQDAGEVSTGTKRHTRGYRGCHRSDVTDHVTVTNPLRAALAKLVVEVEPVVIKLLDDKLVERDVDLLKQVVHKVAGPSDARVGEDTGGTTNDTILNQLKLGDLSAEPNVQNVICGTVNVSADVLLSEIHDTTVSQNDGQV